MIKVGKDIITIPGMKKSKKVAYFDINIPEDGWVDAKKYLPADYDLLLLKVKGRDMIKGWSVGTKWDGLSVKHDDEILYWKKHVE